MLTENDVINHMVTHLTDNGYQITRTATTYQKGIDIIAVKNDRTLYIEAKGGTSSKATSLRHGKPFSNSQVSTHVSMSILVTLIKKNEYPDYDFALALPEDLDHRNMITRISPSLKKLDIEVYFVSKDGSVTIF